MLIFYVEFIEILCPFPENRRYTFRFKNLDQIGGYGKIKTIESQTFEDPMVLAMNLFEDSEKSKEYLAQLGASDQRVDELYENYRPLGACSDYILNEIRQFVDFDVDRIIQDFIEIVPVPISESRGTLTGKYAAKDKITSSAVDLLGEESITRLLHIIDTNNPYRFDLS